MIALFRSNDDDREVKDLRDRWAAQVYKAYKAVKAVKACKVFRVFRAYKEQRAAKDRLYASLCLHNSYNKY
jgi:hypothetical protein